jgi:ankyrin repeat protein
MAQDGSPFDLYIRLHENQYQMLAKRLYRDIEEMELYNVFSNPVLKHPQVCQDFIAHLRTKPYTDLFLHRQEFSNETLRRCQSIFKKSEDMDEWNEEKEIQRLLGASHEIMPHAKAIGWVIYYGHNKILKFIVNQIGQKHEGCGLFMITGNSPGDPKIHKEVTGSDDQYNNSDPALEQIRLLLLSCYSGDIETFEIILSHVNLPLISKIYQNNTDDANSFLLRSPLTVACRLGHAMMVQKLLEKGFAVNVHGGCKDTPLVVACSGGQVDVVNELLKKKVDVNLQDGHGETPLATACRKGQASVAKLLIDAGADISKIDTNGYTPLITACREGHKSVVKLLLNEGVDIRKRVANVRTPLVTACRAGHESVVKLLIKEGASINENDINGYTPLVSACRAGHDSVVKILL